MDEVAKKERRKDPRYDVQLKVDYHTKDVFTSTRVMNLSKGGLFIQTEDPLPLHSIVFLKLSLFENNETIETSGKVVWTYDIKKGTTHVVKGMGIKFLDLTSSQIKKLEDYIATLTAPE